MHTNPLRTWKKFKDCIRNIYIEQDSLRKESALHVSDPVFRGQSNSKWKLETTLERELGSDCGLQDISEISTDVSFFQETQEDFEAYNCPLLP